ncbi:MAG: amino acid adenylation domain-containing protein, partial [bacterium]|nr:amino acid adenylation domain-containing protein [bacterium]
FLGRIDKQVKVRGYRIELGEIENRLNKHPQIDDAVVVVRETENKEKYICSYIVTKDKKTGKTAGKDNEDKKEHLSLKEILLREEKTAPAGETAYTGEESRETVVDRILAQVKENPGKIAAKGGGETITYEKMWQRSVRAARKIRHEYDDRNKLSKSERTRYKRQMLLHGWGIESQEKLKGATVFVAGAGGGASPTIYQLALAGFGTIIVCDFDEVELSNLNRQFLHDETRIGMNKALSAQETVRRINPHVKLIPITEKLTKENVVEMIGEVDIIFDMFDGLEAKFIISQYATTRGIPHIILSMADINAYAAVFHTPHTACYHCIFDKGKWETIVAGMEQYMEKYEKNPLPVVVTSLFMSSAFGVNEAIKIILGLKNPAYNRLVYFNQGGAGEELAQTPGFRAMTHAFSEHFRKICEAQGFDWEKGWRGKYLEDFIIEPDPQCTVCGENAEKQETAEISHTKTTNPDKEQEEMAGNIQNVALLSGCPINMTTGTIAALMAGKTLLALDPRAHKDKLAYTLEESEVRLILVDSQHSGLADELRKTVNNNIKIIPVNNYKGTEEEETGEPLIEETHIKIEPGQAAYMLYPPETTGTEENTAPLVETHKELSNYTTAYGNNRRKNPPQEQKNVITGKYFGHSTAEICAALVNGGTYTFAGIDTATGGGISGEDMRRYMQEELPDYMIPSHYVQLETIPLTPNGKVDRKALPEPTVKAEENYTAPANRVEEALVDIWTELLEVEKRNIGTESNFFELGGHSLSATTLIGRIHREFNVKYPMQELFKNPQIKNIAQYIKNAVEEAFISIQPAEKKEHYLLSSTQGRLYLLHRMQPGSTAYNITETIPMEGETDIEKMENTFKQLIARHETLRTSFHMEGRDHVQHVHENVEFIMEYHEPGEQEAQESYKAIISAFVRPFDLAEAPLIRIAMIKINPSMHVLVADMHHIISDFISHNILKRDFLALYSGEELPALRLQYKDYSEWQQSGPVKKVFKKQEEYWLKEFEEEVPILNLPTDFPRPELQSFAGNAVRFDTGKQETEALKQIARSGGATMYMVLLAVFNIFLAKISGQDEIVAGTPIAGRRHADLENIIGMFVNTLTLKNEIPGNKTYMEILAQLKPRTLTAFENQDYQFEDIVEKTKVRRDLSRNPLFDVMFEYQEMTETPGETTEERREETPAENDLRYKNETSKFDLSLNTTGIRGKLYTSLRYCTKLFKEETILRFSGYYKKIQSSIIENPHQEIAALEIMTEKEKKQVLFEFNETKSGYPREKTIHALFEEQAEKRGKNTAVVYDDNEELTYKELNEKANRLTHKLKTGGVTTGSVVGIMIPPSLDIPLTILAVLKAGGAFLPIDPELPEGRIQYMLTDSSAAMLITTGEYTAGSGKVGTWKGEIINPRQTTQETAATLRKETAAAGTRTPDNPVYVIYTSGTTGKPKGVLLAHRNLVNYVNWFAGKAGLSNEDNALLTSSFTFDLGYTSLFPPLLTGGRMHIIPREAYLAAATFINYITRKEITYLKVTPSLFSILVRSHELSAETCPRLRLIVMGGEAINPEDVGEAHRACPQLEIINHYGPTEATIGTVARYVSFERFARGEDTVSIGKPIANTGAYILDKYAKPVPVGIPGELCVGGDCLARGYLNQPELTAEKFLPYPKTKEQDEAPYTLPHTIYRTGDLARWQVDGNIEFLGRIDHQVKIRGYRIELGEIENHLMANDKIENAVVLIKTNEKSEKYLCAYYSFKPAAQQVEKETGEPDTAETTEIKEYLSIRLPAYMVPSTMVRLETMPLTPNGKINRKALPEPGRTVRAHSIYAAPGNALEEKVTEIWAEELGIDKNTLSIDADFFESGGHSLTAARMLAGIHKDLNINMPLLEVFRGPTIRKMAAYIQNDAIEVYAAIEPVEKKQYYDVSFAQRRLWILDQMEENQVSYNIPGVFEGLGNLDREAFEKAIEALVKRHESLRTTFITVAGEPKQKI